MAILSRVTRGDFTESIHVTFGAIVNGKGELIHSFGDPHYLTCIRSSLKPFQAAASIKAGAVDAAGFSEKEIALMCASHHGEKIHVDTAKSMISKLGYTVAHYECGSHYPADRPSRYKEIKKGNEPLPYHNNCSGKHAGMLSLAKFLDADPKGYTSQDHIVQKTIIGQLKEYLYLDDIPFGIDGCSAPTPFLTLVSIAQLFQKLGSNHYPELKRAYQAMTHNPYMIAGRNNFDSLFTQALNGRGLTKGGGEAVRGISLKVSETENWGIALKVLDGNARVMPIVVMTLLEKLELFSKDELDSLSKFRTKIFKNHRGIHIGGIEVIIEDV
ncbi:MAG: asparaginase [Candidatus Marinimicrobia bacterium]|nr:asparaginase [Candidatus Neomarinimicrobiota bacterium]